MTAIENFIRGFYDLDVSAILVVGVSAAVVVWVTSRLPQRIVTARTLRTRVSYITLPSDEFDPCDEEVVRHARQLTRVHRSVRGLLDRDASAIRIGLTSDRGGRMAYAVEGPSRAESILRLFVYDGVELRPAGGEDGQGEVT